MPTTLRIAKAKPTSDVDAFLRSGGAGTTVVAYQPREIVFSQGDPSDSVMYLQEGTVKLSVLSRSGREAIVAILETGAFFAAGALVGDPVRHEAATAMTAATVLIIPKEQMMRLLHEQHEFSDRFIAHMLVRNIRLEEGLVDQLFNSSEKRLARALLLLAHYGQASKTHREQPRLSQQTLADMVGTTRARVNFFMNKFKKLGYIEYSGGLKVNDSLTTVILRNEPLRGRPSKTG
jgi:CRP-like cAMP-binding protein